MSAARPPAGASLTAHQPAGLPASEPRLITGGFAAHIGPLQRLPGGAGRLRVVLGDHHLNISSRLHGGMAMALLNIALNDAAADLAAQADAPSAATLLAMHCEFISSVGHGAVVEAEVTVTRAARSVLFLSARLVSQGTLLTTASATYRVEHDLSAARPGTAARPSITPDLSGWRPLEANEPFGRHLGLLYGHKQPDGQLVVGFHADADRLDHLADHRTDSRLHDGMLLAVADRFTGWSAYKAVEGRHCVTLTMQVRRIDTASPADWVEFRPAPAVVTPSVAFADGTFHSAGRLLMTVSSAWKVMGPR